MSRWTNVKRYIRRDGTPVKAHRRRVKRRISKPVVRSIHELAKDEREYGVGLDYQSGFRQMDTMLIVTGDETASYIPGQALIRFVSDDPEVFDRDYEILIHTHPKGEHGAYRYPSPVDFINFIVDLDNKKREYAVIIMEDEAVILHIPQEQREKTLKKFNLRNEKRERRHIYQMNRSFDRVGSRKEMRSLIRKWERKYGFTMTRVQIEQLSDYEFKIIPQGEDD